MEWYQAIGIIILAIGFFVIGMIVTELYKALPNVVRGVFVKTKQVFCCNIIGCKAGIHISQLNPMCSLSVCKDCTCEYCE
jgi:hypothetical protein